VVTLFFYFIKWPNGFQKITYSIGADAMQNLELCQFETGTKIGHYESYFLRANHPDKPQAFWIRYTIFSPKGQANKAIGEIWAMYFDAETNKVIAVQEDIALSQCHFPSNEFAFKIGKNILQKGLLTGSAKLNDHQISWNLNYYGETPPVLLFPEKLYSTALPKAKSLVTTPNAVFSGLLNIDGQEMNIEQWQGSENHNWGSKHTDEYAWGQVAGFDNNPNAFLECSTARIKIGPIWSPWMTIAVLVVDGERYYFNSIYLSMKATAEYNYFNWNFKTKNKQAELVVNINAPKEYFAGLSYKNPPKGQHTCLNSKIASCEVQLTDKYGKETILRTKNRAAFEILTDATNHGVTIRNTSPIVGETA